MSRISKLFGALSLKSAAAKDARREPGLVAADWQTIRARLQAEVRGLVSKSIIESIYSAQPGISYDDREVLLQATANRLYAGALYDVWNAGAKPPFEPSKEILLWVQEALDETLSGWQRTDSSLEDGEYDPPIEAKRATTDAIFAALERASKIEVLQEAARRRVEAETSMVAAE